jgi:hypothetical protein
MGCPGNGIDPHGAHQTPIASVIAMAIANNERTTMKTMLDRQVPATGHLKLSLLALAASASFLLTTPALAAVLAGWDVHGLTGGSNNFGTSPLPATTFATNLTVGGLTRGAGVGTTGSAATRGWGGNDWITTSASAAASAADTVSITIAANTGYQLSLSAISRFDYRRSSTGPASGVLQYQVGSGAFTDITTLSYSSTASAGASLSPIDLSGIAALQNLATGTTVTLRIVNYGGSAAGGTWYLYDNANTTASDLEISGTVTAAGGAVNGVCGSANGQTFAAAPTANFCTAGTPSTVNGTGPWSWTCVGINGGSTDNCTANTSVIAVCP